MFKNCFPLVFIIGVLTLVPLTVADAQDLAARPLQKLIDCPSAGGPEAKSYDFELRAFPDGGVLTGFSVGLFKRFTIGLFFGGTKIIGYGKPDWNPQPGLTVQYRFVNESITLPAIALGFTNQGYGAWDDEKDRFTFKAKGFYAVTGKNFTISSLGEIGAHFGVNQNPVDGDDNRLDAWIAADYRITEQINIIIEYSAALNDFNRVESFGKGHGYLNSGFRWTIGERFAIDLHLRDIFNNQKDEIRNGSQVGREIRISYVESL